MIFRAKVYEVVKKIPKGEFLSYQEVAKRAGNKKASRVVGNLMARHHDPEIPCCRVIKNDNEIGGYRGSFKDSWRKAGFLLKEGAIGVIPTDTIYGVCGSALNKRTVEKIYKLRKRNPKKPMIILISSLDDLKKFKIKLNPFQQKILEKIWPSKISVVLSCHSAVFKYLHRGVKTLAFRMPKDKKIRKILEIAGPLAAPSANFEGDLSAQTIAQARKYFRNKVFYHNKGKIVGKPSTLIDLTKKQIKVLRRGSSFDKLRMKSFDYIDV